MINIDLLLSLGAAFKKVPRGNSIFLEGSFCCFYYQLVSGRVRWMNVNEEGREFVQTFIDPGECFGELPLFDDQPYGASAFAEEDSIVIRLHKSVFLKLISEDADLHLKFTRLLAQRIRFKMMLLNSLSCNDPEIMIRNLLNYLKKENKNFSSDRTQLRLTRQQIADMTGLRVETVIRSIRHMHETGELLINKGKVFC